MERGVSMLWEKYVQQVEPLQKLHLFSGVISTRAAGLTGITSVMANDAGVRTDAVQFITSQLGRGRLARWPEHGAAGQDMQVQMEYRLAGIRAGIEHRAKTAGQHSFARRYAVCGE